MTKREYEQRATFERTIAKESALPYGEAVRLAALLCRHGVTYSRLQEDNCNGVGTYYNEPPASFAKRQAAFEARVEHREQLLEKRIAAIVAELGPGFGVHFQGDPRGNTIKIKLPSGRYSDQGQEGYGVPTS